MLRAMDVKAISYLRAWHIAKLCGQSVRGVLEWDAEDFMWAEAIEGHIMEEQTKTRRK